MRIPGFMRRRLLDAARRVYCKRPADFVIAPHGEAYLRRWYVIPRNRWFNVYLHQFLKSDDDRALHDHPWRNVSIILSGDYIEWTYADQTKPERGLRFGIREAGDVIERTAETLHRVELLGTGSVWTLFITGPIRRKWGFLVDGKWIPHDEYAEVIDGVSSIKSDPTPTEIDACAALIRDMYDRPGNCEEGP